MRRRRWMLISISWTTTCRIAATGAISSGYERDTLAFGQCRRGRVPAAALGTRRAERASRGRRRSAAGAPALGLSTRYLPLVRARSTDPVVVSQPEGRALPVGASRLEEPAPRRSTRDLPYHRRYGLRASDSRLRGAAALWPGHVAHRRDGHGVLRAARARLG